MNGRFTAEQQAAIEQTDCSVALRAGAGCGKTMVLTERYLRELSGANARPLNSVISLTFTDKAALELRRRIRKECNSRMNTPGEDRGYWRSILLGLDSAPISTFHGFCSRLLRRHAIEIGIDPEFEIADEQVAPILREEAVSRSINKWLAEKDAVFIELASEDGLETIQAFLSRSIAADGGFDLTEWSERVPESIRDEWVSHLESVTVPSAFHKLVTESEPMLELLRHEVPKGNLPPKRREFLLANLPLLGATKNRFELLAEVRSFAMATGDKAENWSSPEIHKQIGEFYKDFRKRADNLIEQLKWDPDLTLATIMKGQKLAELILAVRAQYRLIKESRGMLDFQDQMILTRDLVRSAADRPELLAALRSRIQFLLVDEFQDTDPIQVEIIKTLLGPAGVKSGAFYVVGDRKQSIYRFRNAKPELFDKLHDEMHEAGRLKLSTNFRSHPKLIDFGNALFSETFPGEELTAGIHVSDPSREPRVTILEFESDESEDDKVADKRREQEATWIARLVRNRLDQGWLIRDPSRPSGSRPAHAGDVAILLGNMNHTRYHEDALTQVGLEYHIVGGKRFYAQQEIGDLVNLLSAIEDPTDSVSLAGCLRGPFFGLSDEGLFWTARFENFSLKLGLESAARGGISYLSETDRLRAERAYNLLQSWREAKDHLPIASFLRRILDESGYEPALTAEHAGVRKLANVRKIVEKARLLDDKGGFTLADFVSRLRIDWRNLIDEEEAVTTEEAGEAVKILTIHKSKGLEFPIVIVPDLNRARKNETERFFLDQDLGVICKQSDSDSGSDSDNEGDQADAKGQKSLGWILFSTNKTTAEDDEALRVFYVAVTRAQDELILSATRSKRSKRLAPPFRLLLNRFDFETGLSIAPDRHGSEPLIQVIRDEPPAPELGPRSRTTRWVRPADLAQWIDAGLSDSPSFSAASFAPNPPE